MSANADYDVSIVESYAPPKNFLPGQKVNKDVYATNTGSIGAFVEETVTTKMSVTKEVDTTTTFNTVNKKLDGDATEKAYSNGVIKVDTGVPQVSYKGKNVAIEDCVELTKDEYYSVEAGSYLAFAPTGSSAALGDIIVRYPDASEDLYVDKNDYTKVKAMTEEEYATYTGSDKNDLIKVNEKMYKLRTGTKILDEAGYKALADDAARAEYIEISYKSDFTPDAEGLYVFRRTIDTTSMPYGEEFFTYAGYYFKDGKYYKVKNLVVTPDDEIDMRVDGSNKDGQLTSATANLVYEVTETVTPKLSYDQAKNRLVATYEGAGKTDYDTEVENLDKAEHELAEARAMLQRALQDQDTADANVAKYRNSAAAFEAELEDVNARIAELNALIGYSSADTATGSGTNADPYTSDGTGTSTSSASGIEKQIENETTAQTNAKNAAETALKNLYGDADNHNKFDTTTGDKTFTEQDSDTTTSLSNASVGSNTKYYKLVEAKKNLDDAKASTSYSTDMFTAYVNEIKTLYSTKTGISAITDFDQLVAWDSLSWTELQGLTFGTDELHQINELTWKYKQAKEDHDEELATANSEIQKYLTATANIGSASAFTATTQELDSADGTNKYYYNSQETAITDKGLEGAKADLKAELATAVAKKAALQDVIAKELENAVTATKVTGETNTAAANLKSSEENYNAKYRAYKKALDELNNAKAAYDNGGDLKIYINLSDDVVTYGGVADKWQMLPVPAKGSTEPYYEFANDTAVFYWTGILEGGETTSGKLIDSVELDKDTTQDMYKAFDFDIDVALKSAQVTYDEAGNVLATAALDELDATGVAITDPANEKDTALAWS